MSPRPAVGNLATIAYDAMEPVWVEDEKRGYPLLHFLHAYYLPMQQIDDIVRDRDDLPGWGILFDPDLCPARYLPWLAMFAGVRLRVGMGEAEIRSRIKDRDGTKRCTPGAIIAAAQAHLIGAKTVILRERYNHDAPTADDPGYLDVITYTDETPDPDAVLTAIREQKDVGLVMSYRVLSGQDWQNVIDTNATWQDVINNYATWQDLIEDT